MSAFRFRGDSVVSPFKSLGILPSLLFLFLFIHSIDVRLLDPVNDQLCMLSYADFYQAEKVTVIFPAHFKDTVDTVGPTCFLQSTPLYRRLWAPVRHLESIHPYANPRGNYVAPDLKTNGYVFVRIRGGFHEIRNSICDVVVVARLLNAALVIPEIQSTSSSKGISLLIHFMLLLFNNNKDLSNVLMLFKLIFVKFFNVMQHRVQESPFFLILPNKFIVIALTKKKNYRK